MDRLLDEARDGAVYLRQPAVANMIVEAIHYNANVLGHYQLHAFVVMPNHVHLLATPAVALPKLTKSLKGITARRANAMLALTGSPFWQEESYDHLVRHLPEFEKIRNYKVRSDSFNWRALRQFPNFQSSRTPVVDSFTATFRSRC